MLSNINCQCVGTFFSVPSAPCDVNLTMISPTSINVSWTMPKSPNGIITHYNITYIGTKRNTEIVSD